jgi:hypothetical protein
MYYTSASTSPPTAQATALRWLSPEVHSGMPLTTLSDVWAFGVTLWEIMTLATVQPYNDGTLFDFYCMYCILIFIVCMYCMYVVCMICRAFIIFYVLHALYVLNSASDERVPALIQQYKLPIRPATCDDAIYDVMAGCWQHTTTRSV